MLLLIALVPVLPKTRLHLIPTLVTEAVLGTKEVNEKARNAAFDLLVVMAKKMSEGGVVDLQLLKGDDADAEKDDEGMDTAAPAGNGKRQERVPDPHYRFNPLLPLRSDRQCRGIHDNGCSRSGSEYSSHD